MISQADDASLPMTFRVNPGPTHITFMSNGEEVGKLHLEDPLRFEGNTEASACVFFEHVVALNAEKIRELEDRIEELEEQYAEAVTQRDLARG